MLPRVHPRSVRIFTGEEGVAAWKAGRRRILQAVLEGDEELARFEAERYRRRLLSRFRELEDSTPESEPPTYPPAGEL
jgi:hypothetical protein